jgi:hypothetical protein
MARDEVLTVTTRGISHNVVFQNADVLKTPGLRQDP